MHRCDEFLLTAQLDRNDSDLLSFECRTDLPEGTHAIVSVERHYTEKGAGCLWSGFGELFYVETDETSGDGFRGFRGRVKVSQCDMRARKLHREIRSRIPKPEELGDTLWIKAVVGLRQRLKTFGKNNCNLFGDRVEQSGEIRIVQAEVSLCAPMLEQQTKSSSGT